jgi:predicted Zn-dependent protease
LLLAADEEAEMAGVMAHEIAHVAAYHYGREMTRAQLLQISSIPLIIIGGPIGYGAYEASGLAIPMTFLKFSRDFETEADYLGVEYMYHAGYDPSAFVSFFEKIQAMEKKKPGILSKAFASHPQTPDRVEKTQKEIRKILPSRPQYIVTTSEFDEVKARLASIENRHKVLDPKDTNKPSLRRTSAGSDGNTGNGQSDDDRPTLKRRDDSSNWRWDKLGIGDRSARWFCQCKGNADIETSNAASEWQIRSAESGNRFGPVSGSEITVSVPGFVIQTF